MSIYRDILKEYWGYDNFRGIQEEIIESIGAGRDTLGLMPTGGGKSITFQVPALAKEGICIVITPLIALMKDQVQNLKHRGIKALAIYSGMTKEQIVATLENCIFGDYKFLYISPERIASEIFQTKLRRMKVSMITVDESHCISQWGYDFRPSYLQIAEIRQLLPGVPVLALTATATPEVSDDIQERLLFKEKNLYRMSFERTNLIYVVRESEDKLGELRHILGSIPGSAIVYVRNRRRTKEIAEFLIGEGISAEFYHAGLSNATKDLRQGRWKSGESRVMVSTNAFGMGIDKPDVRLVIHMDIPDSIEAYFQEAGRAGRDGQTAYAVALYQETDKRNLRKRVADNFPEKKYIKEVYEHLQYYYQMAMGDGLGCVKEFNIADFCRKFKHYPVQVDSALRILTLAGYIEYTEEQENASRILFTVHRDELYSFRNNDPEVDSLIQSILRTTTGVFTDYGFINEDNLSVYTGLTRKRIYEILIYLAKIHIISYIPQKKTPYIIYTRERRETERLHFPKEVYEERRERYVRRIEAMLEYIESTDVCRSRLLLNYFAERNEHECGHCDVCIRKRKESRHKKEEIKAAVVQRLELQPVPPRELYHALPYNKEEVSSIIDDMLDHEVLIISEGCLQIKK